MYKSQPNHQNHGKVNPHERSISPIIMKLSRLTSQQVIQSKKEMALSIVPPPHFYSQMLAPHRIHKH